MESMKISYAVTPSDLRQAANYASTFRNRKGMRFCLIVLLGIAGYGLGAWLSLWKLYPVVLYAAIPFAIWILIVLGNANLRVFRLIRSSDLVGATYNVEIDGKGFALSIPSKNASAYYEFRKFACAIETGTQFLFCVNSQDMFLIPKRALSEEQIGRISGCCRAALKDRFVKSR